MDNAASTTVLDYSGNGRNGTAFRNTSLTAAAGPNSWATVAYDADGSKDLIALGDYRSSFTDKVSVYAFVNPDIAGLFPIVFSAAKSGENGSEGFELRLSSTTGRLNFSVDETTGRPQDTAASSTVGSWSFACGVYDGSAVKINDDGIISSGVAASGNIAFGTSGATWRIANRGTVGGYPFNGKISNVGMFSRSLSSGEQDEARLGPEPINTVAPVVSGTETEGQTLSCTTGTWALGGPFSGGSNGTITYTYQWTRSDDGSGTNEANISGATSSTYTLQAADVGKYIRCYVAATNNGGRDVAADTPSNFLGAVASASTSNRRRRLLICGAA